MSDTNSKQDVADALRNPAGLPEEPVETQEEYQLRILKELDARVKKDYKDNIVSVGFTGSKRLNDDSLEVVSGLKKLRHLDLSGTQITDTSFEHFKGLKSLETLNLSNIKITSKGLGVIKKLTSLTSLNLSRTKLTNDEIP
ncbi:hypothetical protein MNBD_PLANCTO02-2105, partial [hydrothermal vent metagenome]